MSEKLEICSENDLFEAIRKSANDELQNYTDVQFVGWPIFEIIIKGEDFEGGMPTRVMPFFLSYQKILANTYKQIAINTNYPTKELLAPELIVSIEAGSSKFKVDLEKVLNCFSTVAGLFTQDTWHTVLNTIGSMVPKTAWKDFLNHRIKMRKLDIKEKNWA